MTGVNLLVDRLIRTEPCGPSTLPGVFDGLSRSEISSFPALRPHQRAAWHMFLVQLAVLAVEASGWPEDEAGWERALRALTGGEDDPWRLVVEDQGRPAFMQPPDPGGLKWTEVPTPDALDMLITSKNHDLKARVADRAAPEDWVFALVSLQTMEGLGGRGNYGIARMNGGYSSRPILAISPASETGDIDLAAWWRRDVERLIALRARGYDAPGQVGGYALLWTLSWPENSQLAVADLDPLFIEVCRRVRLDPGPVARRANSSRQRIDAKAFHGAVGDPWVPVDRDAGTSLSLSSRGFDYRKIKELLFDGNWQVPPLAVPGTDEVAAEMLLIAEAMVRGQGKTEGLKRRVIPLPHQTWLGDDVAALADVMVDEISKVDGALREAVALFVARGDREGVGKEQRLAAAGARARFDTEVDRVFFPSLWARLAAVREGKEAEAQAGFRATLVELADRELRMAFATIPIARMFAPRARVRAEARFRGLLRKAQMIEDRMEEASDV